MKELEISEPNGKVKAPAKITDHRLDRAAKELDLVSLSARGLKNFSAIGRFLDQIGVVEYGNGRLIGTAEAISNAIKSCAQVVAKPELPDELRERFMELQLRLCGALDRNTAQLAKLNETAQAQKPGKELPNKPFILGSHVSPVTVNVLNVEGAKPVIES